MRRAYSVPNPTEAEIRAEIERLFNRWNEIACGGCSDPFFTDGENMELVRNNISAWYRQLHDMGLTVRDFFGGYPEERPLPQTPPQLYMVPGRYADRLKKTRPLDLDRLVWGKSGEYAI